MNKADFLKILENYRKGIVTAEERDKLVTYYDAFENESDVLATMGKSEQKVLKEEILRDILRRLDGL